MRLKWVFILLVLSVTAVWGGPVRLPLPEGTVLLGGMWAQDGDGIVALFREKGEGVAELFSLPAGESLWRAGGLDLPPKTAAWALSPDGGSLAVGCQRGIKILSVSDGTVSATVELEERFHPLSMAFFLDHLVVALEEVRGFPGRFHLGVWDAEGVFVGRRELGPRAAPARFPKAAFSPDGRFFAFAAGTEEEPEGEAWTVHVFDLALDTVRSFDLRELLPDLPWDTSGVQVAGIAVEPDGDGIAVGLYSADPGVELVLRLNAVTGELIGAFYPSQGKSYVVDALAYSPDGAFLAFAAYSPLRTAAPSALVVADLTEEEPALTVLCRGDFPGECPFQGATFSPDGRRLASIWRNTVYLWDLCPEALELPAPGWTFSFSSGGAYHPKGFGEWHVRLDAEGRFDVSHQVRDTVEPYGPFQLEPEEAAELWALIQAAGIPSKSSTRPGIPDEPLEIFLLDGPTCAFRVELWAGEVEEDAALTALIEKLAALIREYTGEEPIL